MVVVSAFLVTIVHMKQINRQKEKSLFDRSINCEIELRIFDEKRTLD